jgi:hypothetical protein
MIIRDRFSYEFSMAFLMDFGPKMEPDLTLCDDPFTFLFRYCSAGGVFEGSLTHVGTLLAPFGLLLAPFPTKFRYFLHKSLPFGTRICKAPSAYIVGSV